MLVSVHTIMDRQSRKFTPAEYFKAVLLEKGGVVEELVGGLVYVTYQFYVLFQDKY